MIAISDLKSGAAALALGWVLALPFAPGIAGADEHVVPDAYGYLVFRAQFHDPQALAAYGRAVGALVGEFGGRFLAVAASPEVMEGSDDGRRLVILRFPSVTQARAFWSSDAYAEVKALREGAGTVDAVLVEGVAGG